MSLGYKINTLKKILRHVGVNSLCDYQTKVYAKDLKNEDSDKIIKNINEYTDEIEKYYGKNVNITTVDQIIKLIRELCDDCNINYEMKRTAKTNYFRLVANVDKCCQYCIGDFVINKQYSNSMCGLMFLVAHSPNNLRPCYAIGYTKLLPELRYFPQNMKSLHISEGDMQCDSLPYLCISFNSDSEFPEKCIECINININTIILSTCKLIKKTKMDHKILCLYETNMKLVNNSNLMTIDIMINDKHNDINLYDISIIGTQIFLDTPIRRNVIQYTKQYLCEKYDNMDASELINNVEKYYIPEIASREKINKKIMTIEHKYDVDDKYINKTIDEKNEDITHSIKFDYITHTNGDFIIEGHENISSLGLVSISTTIKPKGIIINANNVMQYLDRELLKNIKMITGETLTFNIPNLGMSWISCYRLDIFTIDFIYDKDVDENNISYTIKYFDNIFECSGNK